MYWGIHNMREKLDKYYPTSNYDIHPETVNLLEEDELIVIAGDSATFVELRDFVIENDMTIESNFEWYKSNPDMGGKWQVMSSMAVGSMSMVTATSGKGLNALRKAGVLASNIPYIWPSQGPDIFYQPNPKTK
jgi:hypothetical protein